MNLPSLAYNLTTSSLIYLSVQLLSRPPTLLCELFMLQSCPIKPMKMFKLPVNDPDEFILPASVKEQVWAHMAEASLLLF